MRLPISIRAKKIKIPQKANCWLISCMNMDENSLIKIPANQIQKSLLKRIYQDQEWFILGMKKEVNIQKSINIIHLINSSRKGKSINAQNAFYKILHLLLRKTRSNQNKKIFPEHNKEQPSQALVVKEFPLKSETRPGCLLSNLLLNMFWEF